jgi:hypothetical protein
MSKDLGSGCELLSIISTFEVGDNALPADLIPDNNIYPQT